MRLRQRRTECGNPSTFAKIVAPVVVKPEIVSKKASKGEVNAPVSKKGSIPIAERRSHTDVTASIPSRREARFLCSL